MKKKSLVILAGVSDYHKSGADLRFDRAEIRDLLPKSMAKCVESAFYVVFQRHKIAPAFYLH